MVIHSINYRNLTQFPGVEILWKRKVTVDIRTIRAKLCGNSEFTQNFHIRKTGGISVFYTVIVKLIQREGYLGPCQTSMMEYFCENIRQKS